MRGDRSRAIAVTQYTSGGCRDSACSTAAAFLVERPWDWCYYYAGAAPGALAGGFIWRQRRIHGGCAACGHHIGICKSWSIEDVKMHLVATLQFLYADLWGVARWGHQQLGRCTTSRRGRPLQLDKAVSAAERR